MGVIFTREIKALFRDVKAMICMAVFVLASGVLFLTGNVLAGYGAINSVYSSMSLIVAITVPAVAATCFTSEHVKGRYSFLCSLPVTSLERVMGKILALFAFFMIPTAVLVIYPIMLSAMGGGSLGAALIMLLVLIFNEIFVITLCAMISAFCKKSWVSLLISYGVLAALFVLGLVSALFTGVLRDILRFVSPFRRFDPIVFDLLDLSSVVFYLSLSALFVFVCISVSNGIGAKRRRGSITAAVAVLSVLVLVCNVLAYILPTSLRQLDISDNRRYSIGKDTKAFIDSLDEDVTVYLINPSSAEEKLHSYIRRYCEQSDRITLKEIDTMKDTEFLKNHGISSTPSLYSILVVSEKRSKLVTSDEYFKYYHTEMGFMPPSEYEYGLNYYSQMYQAYAASGQVSGEDLQQLQEIIYSLTYETTLCFDAENAITTAVEYVTSEYVPTIYFISDHGEKNADSAPLELSKLTEIPKDASLLIINDPDSDYTDAEIAMIQRYSERGGKLLVLTDADVDKKPNLLRLLACYGLSLEEGTVVDTDGDGKVTAVANSSSDVMADYPIGEITLNGASAIAVSTAEGSNMEYSNLLSVEIPTTDDGQTKEKKALAVSVKDNGVKKLIWFTGGDTFNLSTEGMSDAEKKNITYVKYCLQAATSWLWSQFSSSISFSSPRSYTAPTVTPAQGVSTFVEIFFIFLLPVGAVSVSLLTVYSRRRRSRAIKIIE